MGQGDYSKKAAYVAAGSAAAYGLINAYAELPFGDNARLRKYYAHKSLPDVKEKGTYNPHKQRQKETDRGDNKTAAKAKSKAVDREKKSDGQELHQYHISQENLDAWGIDSGTVTRLQTKLNAYNSSKSKDPEKFIRSLPDDEVTALWVMTNFGEKK
jgi:hypothetical protein